ncbi:hypothetical protein ACOSQ4_013199 [Xanthoceras sorbifolium]
MGKQSTRIENILHKVPSALISKATSSVQQASFKPLHEIHKRIVKLKLDEPSSSKNINVLKDINVLSSADVEELGEFESQLKDNNVFDSHSFDGRSIVEWNIDGQSEYQIIKTLKHMMMFTQQLINLKCPSLSHFKWYKDVFFSKVFQRKDSSMDFWKERFLAGLTSLFAKRVRTSINKYGGSIPFHALTYGNLSTEVVAEGLAICTKQKLQRKMDKGSTKKTMRDFCEQYGYNESFSKPLKNRSKLKSKKFRSYKKKNFFKRRSHKDDDRDHRRKKKPYLNSGKGKKRTPICYRCVKAGHYSSSCTIKEKINALDCSDKMKRYMKQVLLSDTNEDDDVNYTDDVPDTDSDSESTESSSSSEEEEQCDCDHYKSILRLNGLSINVLQKEDNLILDCIDALNDPVKKRSALEKYIAMAQEPKPSDILARSNLRFPSNIIRLNKSCKEFRKRKKLVDSLL